MPNDHTTQAAPTPAPAPAAGTDPFTQLDQQLQQLMSRSMQKRTSIPVPPTPAPGKPSPMMQGPALTHAEGTQLFFHNLGATIGNAVQQQKEKQIKDATGTLQTLHDAWENAQDMADGDQEKAKALFNKLPQVQQILGDPKKLKQLTKLSSWDAMNPEKNNTSYHEAAKRVGQASRARTMMDAVKNVIGVHRQSQQQRQPMDEKTPSGETTDQVTQRAAWVLGHAQPVQPDIKSAVEIAKTETELQKSRADLTRAQQEYRDKYDIRPDKDGNIVAIDKSDPTKVVRVTDASGKEVTAPTKAGAAPKVAMVENVPYGVTRDGKIVTPDSKDWTAQDATVFEAAKAASAAGEANKSKLADKRATFFSSLPQAVMSKVDDPAKGIKAGELSFVSRQEAAANPAKYAPVGAGDKTLGTQARFGEIQRTVDMANSAIASLPDTGFDAKARAQLAYVMRAPDPASALDAFFKSDAATTLTDAQIDYVTSLASLAESAQALTSLQGIGARGSDRLRASIVAMLPGTGTPSRKYATMQMKKFQVELDQLRKGVPSLGGLSGDDTTPAKPNAKPSGSKADPLNLGI